jgi:hypothetical protein
MIGGRSALLAASGGLDYGNWEGNYSDVSLLLRGGVFVSDYSNVSLLLRDGTSPYSSVSLLLRNGASDESPTPKTLTAVGNAGISTTTFKYGSSALDFPGTIGSHYSVSGLTDFTPGSGAWTVEAWIYPKSTANWVIMSGSNFYISTFNSATYIGDGIVNIIGAPSVPSVNVWTHVAAVRESGGTVRLFFNGIQQAISTDSMSTAATSGVLIGGRTAGVSLGSDALLDDVRITKNVARYVEGTGAKCRQNRFLSGTEQSCASYRPRFPPTAPTTPVR